jgi:HlyD family secretion protein
LVAAAAGLAWWLLQPPKLPAGFTSSNGRVEATEVDIATKLAERIKDELVDEGDFVTAGQEVAHMNTDVLAAQRREAVGKLGVAKAAVETAQATLRQRESERDAAVAIVAQRNAEFDLATYLYDRAKRLGTPSTLKAPRSGRVQYRVSQPG